MQEAVCRRWARAVLVLAALLGVVLMHNAVAPADGPAVHAPAAVASSVAGPATPMGSSSAMPGEHPMPMPHAVMHLCLAVLAAGVLLGLLAAVFMTLFRPGDTLPLPVAPVVTRPSRPPVRTAVRLAELCVLRN